MQILKTVRSWLIAWSCWLGGTVDWFLSLTTVFNLPGFPSSSRSVNNNKSFPNLMFGKYFLHRPIYSKTAVNVLPKTVLLKCSNCDTVHGVGQPCPAVWSGHFNLKDLGTAPGNGARNYTTETEAEDFSSSHLQYSKVCSMQSLHTLFFQCFLWLLSLQFSWNYQACLLTSGQIIGLPEYSCVHFAVLVLKTAGEHCLIPCTMLLQQIQVSNISADKQVNVTL